MKQAYLLIVLTVAVFATRLPTIIGQSKYYIHNTDELSMTLATADRFLGVPYIHSAWPAGTLQMATLPAIAADFALGADGKINIATFADYISRLYRDPWHMLRMQKLIVAALASFGIAAFASAVARAFGKQSIGILAALVVATAPVFWIYSGMAVADAISIGLLCIACWMSVGMREYPHKWAVIGGVFGLAVASKLSVVLAAPFLVALYFWDPAPKRKYDIVPSALGVACGFGLACPYAWIEPVRFMKTVLANSMRSGTPLGLSGSINFIGIHLGWGAAFLALIGIFGLGVRRKFKLLFGVLGSLVCVVLVVSRAGVVYDRYVLPLVVPLAFAAAEGCDWISAGLAKLSAQRFKVYPMLGLTAIALAVGLQNTTAYFHDLRRRAAELERSEQVFQGIQQADPKTPVLIFFTPYILTRMAEQMSRGSLEGMANNISRDSGNILLMTGASGLDATTASVFGNNLNGWEQVLGARLRAMAVTAKMDGGRILFWSEPWLAQRFGFYTKDQAQVFFDRSESALWVEMATSKSVSDDKGLILKAKHGGHVVN